MTPKDHCTIHARQALTAEEIAFRFGAKTDIARQGVRALYEAIRCGASPLQSWAESYRATCGQSTHRSAAAMVKLAEHYDIAELTRGRARAVADLAGNHEALLFALHAYYAVLVKLLVGQMAADVRGLPGFVSRIARAGTATELRRVMQEFEADDFVRQLAGVGPCPRHLYSWYLDAWSGPIETMLRQMASELIDCHPAHPSHACRGRDLLKTLYQELFPRRLRHALGEYYTPDWLADHVLRQVGYEGVAERRVLDPACGSGTFLVAAIARARAAGEGLVAPDELCRQIFANIVGFDLNPLAVLTARANYLMALGGLLTRVDRIEIPVYLCDSILEGRETAGTFDCVVGNPPWIAWDNLPAAYRSLTKPLWGRYGLFSLSARDARHGGGKKDLSGLMLYVSADRYLRTGGRLAMVVTQTLLQSKGSGEGFRRFRIGMHGDWLKVVRVDDMVAIRPFRDAANWTSVLVLEKGLPTAYPVPYVQWHPSEPGGDEPVRREYWAEPIEPERLSSPWLLRSTSSDRSPQWRIGPSDYTAHLGANSGGANGVYWVEVVGRDLDKVRIRNCAGKSHRVIEQVEQGVEADLLYPLLRWGDVRRYQARPSAHLLLAQDVVTRTGTDETVMRRDYPRTYGYLKRFESVLRRRAAYRRYQDHRPFYSMYNVGEYTVAPIKVVWRRMDRQINAAVVEEVDDATLGRRPVIPQETCVLIACEMLAEAHYVCAMLNSETLGALVRAHSVQGGKGFGTPSVLDFLGLQRYSPRDPRHRELAALSAQAHAAVSRGEDCAQMQQGIDGLAREMKETESGSR